MRTDNVSGSNYYGNKEQGCVKGRAVSKKASNFQKKVMSLGYRGKEIFKPLNTGRIDERVACVREWVANIFFYTKNGTTIMIDAGYNYDRLREKMGWLDIDPAGIKHILITHQDTDHVGAVERDSDHLFADATLYIGEMENCYLTGEVRRKGLKHVFQEICEADHRTQRGYLRLKVLELFYLLSEHLPDEQVEESAYYPSSTISKIKDLKESLMTDLDKKYSLQNWADFYGLGRTTMMECFKAIYGKSIYAFQKEYKMQIASQLLSTTELSVSEIAVKLGYSNSNKFSTAFKAATDLSPREYRRQNN